MISLYMALATAATLFFVWRFWRDEEPPATYQRGLTDVFLDWRCEAGHSFRMLGQVEPRLCPTCGKRAYPVVRFQCPVHGPFEVAVRYSVNEERVAHPSQFRVGAGEWVTGEAPLTCPRCQRPLGRVRKDPFEDPASGERKPGG